MSKHYKAEDIDNAIREAHAEAESNEIGEAMFHLHCVVLDLPTIEVSEDCISRAWLLNKLTEYEKDYALNELDDWQNVVVEWITTDIEDAPSVVPSITEDRDTQVLDNWQVHHRNTTSAVEDCISRADLIKQMIDYQNLDTVNTYNAIGAAYCVELAENAPSVVPTVRKNRTTQLPRIARILKNGTHSEMSRSTTQGMERSR